MGGRCNSRGFSRGGSRPLPIARACGAAGERAGGGGVGGFLYFLCVLLWASFSRGSSVVNWLTSSSVLFVVQLVVEIALNSGVVLSGLSL
jgi:galactokinase/mevalonate kinase-like predicted kinase